MLHQCLETKGVQGAVAPMGSVVKQGGFEDADVATRKLQRISYFAGGRKGKERGRKQLTLEGHLRRFHFWVTALVLTWMQSSKHLWFEDSQSQETFLRQWVVGHRSLAPATGYSLMRSRWLFFFTSLGIIMGQTLSKTVHLLIERLSLTEEHQKQKQEDIRKLPFWSQGIFGYPLYPSLSIFILYSCCFTSKSTVHWGLKRCFRALNVIWLYNVIQRSICWVQSSMFGFLS